MGQIKNIKLHIVTDIKNTHEMVSRLNRSFFFNYACTSFESLLSRTVNNSSHKRHLHVTCNNLTRTQWSYTRPRNTGMKMDLPRRLIDGKFYRNQGKGGRGADGRIVTRHKG